jgi:hypothetical protein
MIKNNEFDKKYKKRNLVVQDERSFLKAFSLGIAVVYKKQ